MDLREMELRDTVEMMSGILSDSYSLWETESNGR